MTTDTADRWGPKQWLRVRLYSLAFLAFLAFPVASLLSGGAPTGKVVLGLVGLAVFVACYVRVVWRSVPVPYDNKTPYALTGALVVGAALVPLFGYGWVVGLAFYANALLLVNVRRRWRILSLFAVTGSFVVVGLALTGDAGEVLGTTVSIVAIGGVQVAFARQVEDAVRLRRARAELARLAVAEERLRISRDLHDVLGQRLAAVALKSELAARLSRSDPERAEAEMTEVSKIAREALDEVRATVAGYRDASLATEVRTAVALLAAASVETTVSGVPVSLSPAVEEVASWVVREASTNVVRHAHADRCRIVLGRVPAGLSVEVADDGVASGASESGSGSCAAGAAGSGFAGSGFAGSGFAGSGFAGSGFAGSGGHGLAGLAERIAAIDGSFDVGAVDGWFTVRAVIPA
jgi:two-component system, NarL family, sensor histidine kinase DesK